VDIEENAAGASGGEQTATPTSSILDEWDGDDTPTQATPTETAAADDVSEEAATATDDDTSEEAAPEPTEATEETPAERKLRLRDGTEVTEADLKKAYGRQKEFEREQAEFAAERAKVQAEITRIRQQEQFFAQQMPVVLQTLRQQIPPPPDETLRDVDPIAYANQRFAHEDGVRNFERAQQAQYIHQQQTEAARAKAIEEYRKTELTKLVERMPELKDEKRLKEMDTNIRAHVGHYGFSVQEYAQVDDHRSLAVLADAVKWRMLQANKPKAVEKAKEAPPVVQAPARRRSTAEVQSQVVREQLSRLAKTGKASDAEAFLSRFE
jgi:hypothetical protein